jgi:hypothetical protein
MTAYVKIWNRGEHRRGLMPFLACISVHTMEGRGSEPPITKRVSVLQTRYQVGPSQTAGCGGGRKRERRDSDREPLPPT